MGRLNLHEFFMFNVDKVAQEMINYLKNEVSEQMLDDQ